MAPQEVAKIVAKTEEKTDEAPKLDIRFKPATGCESRKEFREF